MIKKYSSRNYSPKSNRNQGYKFKNREIFHLSIGFGNVIGIFYYLFTIFLPNTLVQISELDADQYDELQKINLLNFELYASFIALLLATIIIVLICKRHGIYRLIVLIMIIIGTVLLVDFLNSIENPYSNISAIQLAFDKIYYPVLILVLVEIVYIIVLSYYVSIIIICIIFT